MKFTKFLIGVMAVLLLIAISCKKEDILGEDFCSLVNISSNGDLSISGCTTGPNFSAQISDIQYDQYGRRSSYDYDITCNSGDRYYGHVSLDYNEHGQVTSATVTINGETCQV